MTQDIYVDEEERVRRWRLILGKSAEESTCALSGVSSKIDAVLQALYEDGGSRRGGLGASQPAVQRWLGDIRTYFPKSVVRVMQRDALERLHLTSMLTEPEILETLEVDVNLVATLLTLSNVIPERTKETARAVVRKLVDQLMKRLKTNTISSVQGVLNRSTRTNRPRMNELDFKRTIKLNLQNWDAETQTLFADRFVGYGRKRRSLRDVVLCVDQSGSMGRSVVYSSIFAAVLGSMPALSTRLILFDTSVVDITEKVSDPVDVLFGAQLGGGTDITPALAYARSTMTSPNKTIFVLVSDLEDGGNFENALRIAYDMTASGVNCVCLLALDDEGKPSYDVRNAVKLTSIGVPTFACTPDLFPEMLAEAINKRDVGQWASRNGISAIAPAERADQP
ncbi:MAG: VWA domain-containing protein [Thermoguttaceae bacterium]|nr:VWA domain-containing protein [Thermoguttaceae bacterium]